MNRDDGTDGRGIRRARRRGWWVPVVAVAWVPAGLVFGGPREAELPPDFDEQWFVVTLHDPATQAYRQCGHMHAVLRRVGDEVHSQTRIKFKLRRGGAIMEVLVIQQSRETLDGRPLGFENALEFGTQPQTLSGTIQDGKLTLVTEQFGVEKSRATYPFDPGIRFAWGLLLEQRRHGLKQGTHYTTKVYDPSLRPDGPLAVAVEVRGREQVEVLGRKRELTRITTSMKLGGSAEKPEASGAVPLPFDHVQIDADNWVDEDLNPVIITMDMGLMKLRMYRTTKKDALKQGAPPEMFLNTLVPVAQRIGPGARAVKLRLRLRKGAKQSLPTLPTTAMQTFERLGEREGLVTVRRIDWERIRKAAPAPDPDAALQPFLDPSPICDSGDRKIRRLARRAVRGLKTPAEKADALRKFVTDYITDKNMDIGFATASEVVRARKGDCTEHGVLLAALARAAGLPARGVSGLVEVPGGGAGRFGYHMWTQAYIDGRWVDIDAALRQTDCEPTHVALCVMPLGDEGMVGSITSLIPLLGQLEIEVLDIER